MISVISGTVRGLQHSSATHGSVSTSNNGNVSGQINTTQSYNFRVEGKAVSYHSAEALSLHDGDHVSVAGEQKTSGFQALAILNNTSGALHQQVVWPHWFGACIWGFIALIDLMMCIFALVDGAFLWFIMGLMILAAITSLGYWWCVRVAIDINSAVKMLLSN